MAKSRKIVFLLLLFVILVFIYLIPFKLIPLAKHNIRTQLEKLFDTEVDIKKISFNLLTASITLADLSIKDLLEAEQVIIKPELKKLIKKHFIISKILLNKPYLIIRRQPPGLTTQKGIIFPAKEILIKDGRLQYIHEITPEKIATVDIHGIFLYLKNYPHPIGHIQNVPLFTRVKGRGYIPTEEKGIISISGNLDLAEEKKSFLGDISMDDISLPYFSNFYPEDSQIKVIGGKFSLKTQIKCIHDQLMARPSVTIKDLQLELTQDYTTGDVFELPVVLVVDFFDLYKEELRFTFEVSGSLSNPEFKLGQVISQEVSEVIGASIVRTIATSPALIVRLGDKLITIADKLKEFGLELGKGAGKALEQLGKPAKELIKGLKDE